jgi:PAS domain S-box-containing protein
LKNYLHNHLQDKEQMQMTRRFRLTLAGGLLILAMLLFLSGVYYIFSFQDQFMQRTKNALFAISGIKANQVKIWKYDRLKDGLLMYNNIRLSNNAKRLVNNSQNEVFRQRVVDEFKIYTHFHPYRFFIVNSAGDFLLTWPESSCPPEKQFIDKHLKDQNSEVNFVDFHPSSINNQFNLAMIVPLGIQPNEQPLFLIAQIDPFHGLYDSFKSYLAQTVDVENFFIFKCEDQYKTFTKNDDTAADSLFVQIEKAQNSKLIAELLKDNSVIKRGTGFGGEKVLAVMTLVPDTPWMIVVEMKEQEMKQSLRQRILAISIMGGAFLVSIIGLMIIFARQQEMRLLKFSRENEILLDDLINNQPSGIYRLILDTTTEIPEQLEEVPYELPVTYLFVSKQHEMITGVAEKDLLENPVNLFNAIHPDDRKNFIEENLLSFIKFKRFYWEGRMLVDDETRWIRFDSIPRLAPPDHVIWTGVVMDISFQKKLEQEMEHREAFERLLTQLSSTFVNIASDNCDVIIQAALDRIGEFTGVDRAYIYLLDEEKRWVKKTHEWCAEGIESYYQTLQLIPTSEIPQWIKKLKEMQPIKIPVVDELPEKWKHEKSLLEMQGVKSVAAAPIASDLELYGFLGCDSERNYRKWKDYEIQLLKVFADLVFSATEKLKAEKKLLESQKMLRNVLDTIKVRVFWKDAELRFTGCNKAFAKDAGYKDPEQIIGLNDFDMPWKEFAEKYREDDRRVMETMQPFLNFEEQNSGRQGEQKWVRTSKIPLVNDEGEPIGILGTYQDITEHKLAEIALINSEKKYRILTENAFDGIYLLRNNSFDYVNQRFCEMTGYSFSELTSANFDIMQLLTPESQNLAAERSKLRSQGKEVPGTYEVQIITSNAQILDVEISTNTMSNIGYESHNLGIMRDISERKNNEKLRNQVAIANQSAIFKQNFLANMSHEIRTPLTGVMGMIEILASTNLNDTQTDYIHTLKLSTENLREIINQILDYSKIEAGEVHLKNVTFETLSIFNKARKLYQAACKKDVKLLIEVHPEIPECIEADESRISQIINNLVSNAIKFTVKGQISIRAIVDEWLNGEDVLIRISVEDTGIGIRKAAIPKLFKPFGQVDHEDKRNYDGTGLGLSICKELVALMGGKMDVSSSPGVGSTFWFTFRARKVICTLSQSESGEAVETKASNSLKILYAEDKAINQKVVKLMLNSLGHKVILANNGQEVLDIFKPNEFDLILMDIQMPVMDGITSTRKLRETFSILPPIVGLSANAFEGDREKYMAQGLDEYLTKPVNTDDLKSMIDKLHIVPPQQS